MTQHIWAQLTAEILATPGLYTELTINFLLWPYSLHLPKEEWPGWVGPGVCNTVTTKPPHATQFTGFPLYFGGEIQGLFKNFQGPWSGIFKDKFLMEVYSTDSITAIFNICFCDYGTVLVDKNKT